MYEKEAFSQIKSKKYLNNDQRCHSVKLQKSRGSDRYQSKATSEKQLELLFAKAPRKSGGVRKKVAFGK